MSYFQTIEARNASYLTTLLAPFGPAKGPVELSEELNPLFHVYEAAVYNNRHAEIFGPLPGIWQQLLDVATGELGDRPATIVDLGCGTGFELTQLLARWPRSRLGALTLFDSSPDMLRVCREHTKGLEGVAVTATTEVADLTPLYGCVDLVMTNAVLHHIPRLHDCVETIHKLLRRGGVWINGHEPSSRFYTNPECMQRLRDFSDAAAAAQRRRYLDPRRYLKRALRFWNERRPEGRGPYARACAEAVRVGLFAREPTETVMDRIVDYWVAHDEDEACSGRGLDYQQIASQSDGRWMLLFAHTYNHMGYLDEAALPPYWQAEAKSLSGRFPDDGGSYSAVWRAL